MPSNPQVGATSTHQHAWPYHAVPKRWNGSLCLLPTKMSLHFEAAICGLGEMPEYTSEPSIFHTFDTSKSWVCWPLDIGSLTCPTWESPPKTSHLVGLSLGPKSCLFWQIFGESPLRKTVLEQPESSTLFFGKVNDLIFIGI